MSAFHDDSIPRLPIDRLTRRRLLAGAALTGGALAFLGTVPQQAQAVDLVGDAFNGLASFVVPGNDRYSKRQGVTTTSPGGVDAGAGPIVQHTLDEDIPVVVSELLEAPAPGGLAYALIMQGFALNLNPLSLVGPFASAFANLSFAQKRTVLERIDTQVLQNTPLTYAGNALITLAGLAAFSEGNSWNGATRQLTKQPVGWQLSKYSGVSDGHADFLGYYQDRSEVTS